MLDMQTSIRPPPLPPSLPLPPKAETCGGIDAFDLYKLEWAEPSDDPEYMDCYADSKNDRIMGHMIKQDDMTSAICREHCMERNALYYGTQVL